MSETSPVDALRYTASHTSVSAHRSLWSCSAAPRALARPPRPHTPSQGSPKMRLPSELPTHPHPPARSRVPALPPASAAPRPACSLSSVRQYCHIHIINYLQPAKGMVWMWTVVYCSELVLAIWSLYPSNWIFKCPEWLTPMRRLDSNANASLHPQAPGFEYENKPPPPIKKSGRDELRIGDPPARQGLLLNQKIPQGIFLGFSLLFQGEGIKESNGP